MFMDTKKIIQALTYFAYRQEDKTLDSMKAYKLLWLADRLQLRRCGRTVSGDTYYAMPYGPVPSDAKNILEKQPTHLHHDGDFMDSFIETKGKRYKAVKEPDLKYFSVSDREVLDKVLDSYNKMTTMQLSELSHKYPEWLPYEAMIKSEGRNSSYPIDVDLFFESCDADKIGFFDDNLEALQLAKELYHQYNRC